MSCSSYSDRIETVTETLENDSLLMHNIVQGDVTTVVTVTGGQVKSLAKAINDMQASVSGYIGSISGAVGAANASAAAASGSAVLAASLTPSGFTSSINAKDISDYLFFDGTTANERVQWNCSNQMISSGDFTILIPRIEVPTSLTSNNTIFNMVITPLSLTQSFSAYISTVPFGSLIIVYRPNNNTTDLIAANITGFVSNYGGQIGTLAITRSVSNSSVNVYWNGLNLPYTTTSGGSNPPWSAQMNAPFLTQGLRASNEGFKGRMGAMIPINSVLSIPEIVTYSTAGVLPSWCDMGNGIMNNKFVGTNYDFGSGLGQWTNMGLSSVASDSGNSQLNVFVTGANGGAICANFSSNGTMQLNKKYLLRLGIRNSQFGLSSTRVVLNSTNTVISTSNINADGIYEIPFICPGNAVNGIYTQMNVGSTGSYSIYQPTLIELGPIFKPVIQPVNVVFDAGQKTSNVIPGSIPAGGVFPITTNTNWIIQDTTHISNAGDQQILGASLFADFNKHSFDSFEISSITGTTVAVGSAAAGSIYVLSTGINNTGRNLLPMNSKYPLTANIWVSSTVTGALKHTIRGHLINN